MSEREDILSLDEAGLLGAMEALGAPAFRARQVLRWIYGHGVGSYSEMGNIPAALLEEMGQRFTYRPPELVERQESRDGTRKYLWRLSDEVTVESVGLPSGKRLTVCFSTQAGCGMGCAFCATGEGGLTRNLGPGEIALQVTLVAADFGMRASNAVAMGQGEPFANYEATLGGLRLLNSPEGLGIGARHLTVSTCGLVDGIERLGREHEQFTLAVSLHSAVQRTRDRLMPAMAAYPLTGLRSALVGYARSTGRRPSLEFALIDGVNDTPSELEALVAFCRGMLVHVNLIPANPVGDGSFARPGKEALVRFAAGLEDAGIEVSTRTERGVDIDAACGQLRQRAGDPAGAGPETGHTVR